jgi:predicted unusual protein kinase regulating ubiquinone biosynthesis (AarF/ABC1/UbiB family)
VLVDGTFHADPHPGNVLLTRDHRLALIDVGMVGHVQRALQRQLTKLLLALSEGRGDTVAAITVELAGETAGGVGHEFSERVGALVAEHGDATVGEIEVGTLLIEVCRTAAAHGLVMPSELSLLGKTLLHLDQIARRLDPDFDPNAELRRYATRMLRKQIDRDASAGSWMAALLETKELLEDLPGRANRLLEILAQNKLRLHVDAIDEERLTSSMEKIANRIAAGLVLAALIVGASLLMRVETEFTLFGYPGLAMLLFLGAAGGGVWLILTIFRERRSW